MTTDPASIILVFGVRSTALSALSQVNQNTSDGVLLVNQLNELNSLEISRYLPCICNMDATPSTNYSILISSNQFLV